MEKLKEYKYIVLIVIVLFGINFYWNQYRPVKIKDRCSAEAHLDPRTVNASNDDMRSLHLIGYYNDCLMRFGLK